MVMIGTAVFGAMNMDNNGRDVNANPKPVSPFTTLAMRIIAAMMSSVSVSNIESQNKPLCYEASQRVQSINWSDINSI